MTHMTLLAIVSAVWVLSEQILAWTRRGSASADVRDRGSFMLLWFALVIGIVAGSMLRGFRPARIPYGDLVFWIGIALIVAGIIVRATAIITLGRFFTVNVMIHSDHKLVDRGLYSIVRHPSYSGSLLSFIGLGLAFGSWLSLVVILIGAGTGFVYRIHVEEAALVSALGDDYRRYAARTKRLIPGIY
jgi:protein-S-isoprenylcysteine O-methyltransferase Ste14